MQECSGDDIQIFVLSALIIGLQFILQFISFMAAICTCKVKVELLNDSRYVKAIVVMTFIILMVTTPLAPFLEGYQALLDTIVIISVFSVVVIFLSLTFVPKVRKIR